VVKTNVCPKEKGLGKKKGTQRSNKGGEKKKPEGKRDGEKVLFFV